MFYKILLYLVLNIFLFSFVFSNKTNGVETSHYKTYVSSTCQASILKLKPKVDEIVDPAFRSERIVGIIIGIWDGKDISFFGYGKTDLKGEKVPDENTVFEIGSITKVFTSLLLAKRVTENSVSINDPVSKLLPKYFRIPKKEEKEITLLHLSTHFSGLPRVPSNMGLKYSTNPYKEYSAYNMREFLSAYQLPREPGEKWEYSNLGVGLLGYSLGVKTGRPYKRLISTEITKPLNMKDTCFNLNPEQSSRFAQGYTADLNKTGHWDFDVMAPAGGLRSTASDMLKFATAFLRDDGPLQRAMVITIKHYTKTEIPDNDMGLGWLIMKKNGYEIPWHNGGTGGFSSFLAINKQKNIAVVVLSNTATSHSGVIDDIAGATIKYLLGIPYDPPKWKIEKKIKDGIIDGYAGNYELVSSQDSQGKQEKTEKTIINVKKAGNRLILHMDKKVKIMIYPESESIFFAKVLPMDIKFSRHTTDNTIQMNISSQGENSFWRKIPISN